MLLRMLATCIVLLNASHAIAGDWNAVVYRGKIQFSTNIETDRGIKKCIVLIDTSVSDGEEFADIIFMIDDVAELTYIPLSRAKSRWYVHDDLTLYAPNLPLELCEMSVRELSGDKRVNDLVDPAILHYAPYFGTLVMEALYVANGFFQREEHCSK